MGRRFVAIFAVCIVSVMSGCGLFEPEPPLDNPGEVTVFTRNLYIGAEVDPGNPDPKAALDMFLATNFPARAYTLAEEIADHGPAAVGLQEVAFVEIQRPGTSSPISGLSFDFLKLLQNALAAKNAQYTVAGEVKNVDITIPATIEPYGKVEVRIIDREVVLARKGTTTSLIIAARYAAARQETITVDGQQVPLAIPRGFVAVTVTSGDTKFIFASTHLETLDDSATQKAQARELIDSLRAIQSRSKLPLILVGDFNSPGPPAGPVGSSYQLIRNAGFSDNDPGGFTCCFPPNLKGGGATLTQRIDFIFNRNANDAAQRLSLLSIAITGNKPEDRVPVLDLWPSDHAGVTAKFRAESVVADGT